MADSKSVILFTNEDIAAMSGVEGLKFSILKEAHRSNEAELLVARMAAISFLIPYVLSGKYLEIYLDQYGYKKDVLNKSWWKQFAHIRSSAASKYIKNSRYFAAAASLLANESDWESEAQGDYGAQFRLGLATQCSLLMSALHPDADHQFFRAAISEMPDYVRKKKHPTFKEVSELSEEESAQIQEICKDVLQMYSEYTTGTPEELIAQYISKKYAPKEQPLEGERIPPLRGIAPLNHIIPNNKITNLLSAGDIGFSENIDDFFSVRVSSEKAKKEIISSIMVAYEGENVQITGRRPFTEYDRNVYNAVVSLYVHGDPQHTMTPAMIYRAMTGRNDTSNPSPQQIGAVTKSLDKMRFIRVRIDCTEELKQRKVQLDGVPITNGMIDTYLLNADGARVSAGGHVVEAYRINRPPVLYEYSRAINQVLTVPSELLAIKEADDKGVYNTFVADNDSRIQIKGYMLRRIEGMKGKNSLHSNVISFVSYEKDGKHHPGIYEIAGKESPSTTDAKRIRDYATQALDFWKAKGFITGYEFVKKDGGKAITGVRIIL